MRAFMLAAFACAAVLAPLPAAAQEPPTVNLYERTAQNNDIFSFDWGIPTSPALTLAGLADGKTPTSTSLRDFVVALPTLMGGEEGQAIALDVSVARLFGDRDAPNLFTTYATQNRGGYWRRLMYRTRVGVALFEGNADDDPSDAVPSRVAFGFSASLLDNSDPLMTGAGRGRRPFIETCLNEFTPEVNRQLAANFQLEGEYAARRAITDRRREIFANNLAAARSALGTPDATREQMLESLATQEAELNRRDEEAVQRLGLPRIQQCVERASERAELSADLDVGVGALWRGDPGEIGGFEEAGGAIWFGFRYPWGVRLQEPSFSNAAHEEEGDDNRQYWMVAASGRFSFEERLATGNDTTPEIVANVSEAWIGLERFHPDWRFAARYGYREVEAEEPAGAAFEQSGERYLVSAQFRLGDEESGLWLGLSYGDASGSIDTLDDEAALVTLSYSPPAAIRIAR